jgi:predicted nucleic acid-binding protein
LILVDTGFFVALAARRDKRHEAAVAVLAKLREPLITTWPVLTETCQLLGSRVGVESSVALLRSVHDGAFQLFGLEHAHLVRTSELMNKYRDLPMDLADASLVILAEELGTGRILSTDERDFGAYRWKNRKPFRNLFASALSA